MRALEFSSELECSRVDLGGKTEMHTHFNVDNMYSVACMMPASSSQEQTPDMGSLTVIWIRRQQVV